MRRHPSRDCQLSWPPSAAPTDAPPTRFEPRRVGQRRGALSVATSPPGRRARVREQPAAPADEERAAAAQAGARAEGHWPAEGDGRAEAVPRHEAALLLDRVHRGVRRDAARRVRRRRRPHGAVDLREEPRRRDARRRRRARRVPAGTGGRRRRRVEGDEADAELRVRPVRVARLGFVDDVEFAVVADERLELRTSSRIGRQDSCQRSASTTLRRATDAGG